jgi:radical SAM protein with 4Fe4S-binding SPASM domain
MDLLSRVIAPSRLSLIIRGDQTVAYNPDLNVWHRVDAETAETLRWLRAKRERPFLKEHLRRRFKLNDVERRLTFILKWAVVRQLLHLNEIPSPSARQISDNPPSTLYWICTQACNLSCSYCYQDASDARKNELTTSEGRNLIDQAVEAGIQTFVFTGGEPFLRRDLLTLARYSQENGLKTNIITNGSYINVKRIKQISSIFNKVTISLDHGVAEHHDRARGKGSWRLAAKAIDLLLENGVTVDVNSVLSKPGLAEVEKLLNYIRNRPINQHRITPQSPMARGVHTRNEELTPNDFLDLDDTLYSLNNKIEATSWHSSDETSPSMLETKGHFRNHCGAGVSELAVDPEGWVYPCKLLQNNQCRGENIRNRSISEIFSTDPALKVFHQSFTSFLEPCKKCVIQHECGGGCRGIHAAYSNNWIKSDALFCSQMRRSFELKVFSTTGIVPYRKPSSFVCCSDQTTTTGKKQYKVNFFRQADIFRPK